MASIIAGFVFGFDDKQTVLNISYWSLNYLKFVILSFISLSIFMYTQKLVSKKYGCSSKFTLWKIKRYGFSKAAKFPIKFFGFKIKYFPLGIILPILITLFSNGQLFFAAVLTSIITINPAYRLGKKFTKLTEYEAAKIAIVGPLICIVLAIILSFFGNTFNDFIFINIIFAISYMIPLPGLNGCTILFGSKHLYVLGIVFILVSSFLLKFLNPINTFLLALLIAMISLIVFFYYKTYKS